MRDTELERIVEVVGGQEFVTIYSNHWYRGGMTTRTDYQIDGARVSKKDWEIAKTAKLAVPVASDADYPADGTANQKLAWYAERNLLRY